MEVFGNHHRGNLPWPTAGNTETRGRIERTMLYTRDYDVRVHWEERLAETCIIHVTGKPVGCRHQVSPQDGLLLYNRGSTRVAPLT